MMMDTKWLTQMIYDIEYAEDELASRLHINNNAKQSCELVLKENAQKRSEYKFAWLEKEKGITIDAMAAASRAKNEIENLVCSIMRLEILDKCRDNPLLEDDK